MAQRRGGGFTDAEGNTVELPRDEIQETIEARAAQLADLAQAEPDDQDELRALAEIDAGGDVTFQVWRMLPVSEKGFVGQLTAAELTVQKIQEDYGKGRYRIRGIRSNGSYAGQRTIDIAIGAPKSVVSGTASAPQNNQFQDYLQFLEARNEKRAESMKSWAIILIPALAPVFANLFGNKGPTLAELTTSLANMKALQGGQESSTEKLKELASMMAIMRDMQPEKDTGSTWVDLIRDGVKELPAILPAVTAMAGRAGPIPVQQVTPKIGAAPGTPAPGAPQAAQTKEANPMMALLAWLKEQLSGLAHQASLNKDPGLYAEVVIDNIPPGVDPVTLRSYLAREDWWQMICQFAPQVQPYPQWFAECRQELITGLDVLIAEIQKATGAQPMPSDEE